MSRAMGLAIVALAALVCAWAAESILPRRPPGGLRGLAIVGLVGGIFAGWAAASLGFHIGPVPGGVSLLAALLGSALSISLVAAYTARFKRGW